MEIKAREIKIVFTKDVVPNERNRNSHSDDQIKRLAKIIQATGFRQPLVVSNRSGKLITGHGRLMAAQKLGLNEVPVIYQDFENEEQEFQHLIADNAIASWSDLDMAAINADIADFGSLDIDLLGIADFSVDAFEKEKPKKDKTSRECPNCGELI